MKLDRAEWTGTGLSVGFHVALIAALSISLAKVALPPETPAISVDFVDDVGLLPAAPTQDSAEATQALTTSPDEVEAPPSEAPPLPDPTPAPTIEPARPSSTPAPQRPARPRSSSRPTGNLDNLDIDGAERGNSSRGDAPSASPSAPRFDAAALAGIQQAIRRQVQPCANRQVSPGFEAQQLRVTLELRLARDGRLVRPPRVVSVRGQNADNRRYVERVKDMAVATYVDCAPIRGLPQELYQTPQGGWSFIEMTYRP